MPAQNALRIVRKYVLEFFQPLAAPPNNRKSPKPTQRIQTRRSRDAEDHEGSNAPTTSSNEVDRAKLWTPLGIARGDAEAVKLTQTRRWRSARNAGDHSDFRNKERGKTEAMDPSYSRTRDDERGKFMRK